MISLEFKLATEKCKYTAIITEVEHGKFELKAVYKPDDKAKSMKHDIVLPGRYVKNVIAIIILPVF